MLTLKLFLVPFFIGFVSLVGKRWGVAVAGWLAGLPVVVGPILFLLWLERGASFGRIAAGYSLAAITPIVAFAAVYAWCSRSWRWPASIAAAYIAWLLVVVAVLVLPIGTIGAWVLAAGSLLAAPWILPRSVSTPLPTHLPKMDLLLRMFAGAALTLLVTSLASVAGARVSGVLALLPIISAVLAVFTHASAGSDAVIAMLRGFVRGAYSLVSFFMTLIFVPTDNAMWAFLAATVLAVVTQLAVRRF